MNEIDIILDETKKLVELSERHVKNTEALIKCLRLTLYYLESDLPGHEKCRDEIDEILKGDKK